MQRDAKGAATGRVDGVGIIFRLRGLALGPVAEERATASVKAMAREMNRVGLTTIFDLGGGGTVADSYDAVRRVAERGELTLRVRYGLWSTAANPDQVSKVIEQLSALRPFSGNEFYDLVTFGEVQFNPLVDFFASGAKTNREHLQELRRMLDAAAARGWSVHMHAHHAGTLEAFLDVIDDVSKRYLLKPLRWQFVHADFVTPGLLERMRRHGIAVSVSPSSTLSGEVYQKVIGDARRSMPPLRMLQASGIRWALGTDGTAVANYNPFFTLHWAVTGRGPDGSVVFQQTISREDALIAHTRDAVYFMFEENNIGSIEAGKLADMLILDRDFLSVPADEIREIRPVEVIVGGRSVYRR